MSPLPPSRALYLAIEDVQDPVFGVLHPPARSADSELAVLICPPFGWEEACSYRCRREWAEQLAGAGHATLRIDLPGTGDSGGSPQDPGRFDSWTRSIGETAGWLRSTTGAGRVAAIGIGLGGLLICAALAEGAQIDEIVLWAVPSRGRSFVRELRAFARLETSKLGTDQGATPLQLADGRTGAGGFVLSAETTGALAELDAAALAFAPGQPQRALLLERDGLAVDERLHAHLSACGAEVATGSGEGYGAMMLPPHQALTPTEVFAQTLAWLGERPRLPAPGAGSLESTGGPPAQLRVRASEAIELSIGAARIRETPLQIQQPFGMVFGVLAEPLHAPPVALSAVLLNAGAHRRIGQGRMWVEAARRWAALGVPTLRVDLEGIGDADGDGARFGDVSELYTPRLVEQTIAALDALDARGLGPRYALAGLCSGACWSFHAALQDERAAAAFMINPQTLFWDPSVETARALRRGSRAKLLRGEVPLTRLLAFVRGLPRMAGRRLLARARRLRDGDDQLDRALDRLRDTHKSMRFMFSGLEPLHEELELEGRLGQNERWPNVTFQVLPGDDHILRPLEAQRAAHLLLDRALEQELERLPPDGHPAPAPQAPPAFDGGGGGDDQVAQVVRMMSTEQGA